MGGFADRLQQRLGSGGFADRLNSRMQQPQDEQQPTYGYDSAADDGFKPWSKPGDAGSTTETSGGYSAGKPQWSGGSALRDGAYAAAGGAFSGLGVNPSMFGDDVKASLQMAHERSPIAAGAGQFIGEAGIQTLAAPAALARAPIAMGTVSGALSGLGNSEGTLEERARATGGGMAMGAGGGYIAGKIGGGLSSLLEKKGAQWGEQQATHGLMNRGASAEDLSRLDKLGGRQQFYDDANRLGITGKPAQAAPAARQVAESAEATRAAIEAQHAGVQVDPRAAAAAVRGANPYPGVTRMDRAADRAAQGVQAAGPDFAAQDIQRGYYGNSANFASGSPNQVMGQRVHGAINNEMEDALNLAEPGAGSTWRQAGQDERTGIELGGIAQKAYDTQRKAPWTGGDFWTGGATRLINNNRHGVAESMYGTGAALARGGQAIGNAVPDGLPAALTGSFGGQSAADAPTPAHISQTALDSLYSGGNELGPFKAQFAEAAGSPNPGAVQDLITRLTMTDPKFRTSLLPLLAKRAGTY